MQYALGTEVKRAKHEIQKHKSRSCRVLLGDQKVLDIFSHIHFVESADFSFLQCQCTINICVLLECNDPYLSQ